MKKLIKTVIIMGMMVILGSYSFAFDMTGLEVMEKVYNRDTGNSQTSKMTMTLENRYGDKRIRKISQFSKDFGKVTKKIMFFTAPSDIKNTSFMNWSYDDENKNDEQWIYLPAIKRIKAISSDSKSDYFMGSDFTYDDLGDRKPKEDNHKIIKMEKLNGENCYVIESITKDEDYMYSKVISWVIKDKWIGLKREFYDEDGELLKTLEIKKIDEIDGILTVMKSVMTNIQNNHKTTISLKDVKHNTNISDRQFTERMMKRGVR
ncbi:outer membrane lipoprotein-sorting protein [Haliovirga abyssi]|uniref:Uncharacterized protein TP-0789 domain-containing protein n=1 Tax=Haliovirga abyssi TaxID=2996794 RepID=A0AAU9DGE3_9FUSO|nr:outer membrane lipoprotein-sorting protein [Haliovirga abyssi]BDU51323.1 hypothetical protein HLVA_18920 [Haliovirga abyssi]